MLRPRETGPELRRCCVDRVPESARSAHSTKQFEQKMLVMLIALSNLSKKCL